MPQQSVIDRYKQQLIQGTKRRHEVAYELGVSVPTSYKLVPAVYLRQGRRMRE